MSQSPFVVENLTPVSPNGAPQGTYELTRNSVSPTRVVGRNALGPIEETMPTTHWANFLMMDGCVNKVPLRTGSVYSKQAEAEAYEIETTQELIVNGCIPAHLCPFSTTHFLRGQAYITPGPGESDCGGSGSIQQGPSPTGEYGCAHLRAVAKARKAEVLRKYNAEAELMSKMDDEKIGRLHASLAASVGEAIAKHSQQPADRKRNAKGETE